MYIKVKVKVKAKEEKIVKVSPDHYEIWVREDAKNNRANNRILEILHTTFTSHIIRIVSGHHSPSKIFSLEGKD